MRRFLFILLLFLPRMLWAQLPAFMQGEVRDSLSGEVLGGAVIQIVGMPFSTRSMENGKYLLSLSLKEKQKVTIEVFFTGYKTKAFEKTLIPGKTVSMNFLLNVDAFVLPSVSISANPDTVWGSEELNVADYAFTGDSLLLLTYKAEMRWKRQEESKMTLYEDAVLIQLNKEGKEVARCSAPEPVKQLYTGYFNEIFLLARKGFYIVHREDGLRLEEISEREFRDWFEPIVDSIGTKIYYSTYNPDYPAFEYRSFDRRDSSYSTLRYLVDEEIMEMFRSEYKYLGPREKLEAYRFELKTGVDKEIVAAYMRGFQGTSYYEPMNAPLVVSNDTLLIFEHNHNKLLRLDGLGNTIDSSFISYHRTKGADKWGGKVIRDKGNSKVYTFNSRNGITTLFNLNTRNGNYLPVLKLRYKYAEKIGVFNEEVYYVYRPFESSQKRFLYKEKVLSY